MNAVERLLAQGELLLILFDQMYQEPDKKVWDLAILFDPSVDAPPPTLPGEPWVCGDWWRTAVQIALREDDFLFNAERASALLRDRLSQRRQLLDRSRWQHLVAGVVRDCRAWDFLAKKVVKLAQEIADSVIFIEEEMTEYRGRYSWETVRYSLHRNLGLLRRYAQPPEPVAAISERGTSTAKQAKRSSRKGVGGRPEKFTLKFIREVVKARERYLQDAARLKHPVLRLPEWLSDYFSEKSLPLSSLPSRDPKKPEEWSIRANRFWKAAKQRLSRVGN